jgi:hypothetical protein
LSLTVPAVVNLALERFCRRFIQLNRLGIGFDSINGFKLKLQIELDDLKDAPVWTLLKTGG